MAFRLSPRWPVILVLALAHSPTPASAQDPASRELMHLEDVWAAAAFRGDGAAVEKLLAPDFIYTSVDGKVLNKDQLVQAIAVSTSNSGSGANSDYQVRVYGNAAVVTGLYTVSTTTAEGPTQRRSRWTDTWIRQPDGTWLCVATQNTRMASSP